MDTIFMNLENSKTSDPCRLLLNLSNKVDLKRSDKYVALSNLGIYYTWKNKKKKKLIQKHKTTYKNLKYQFQGLIMILNYLMITFCIRYSKLFCIYLKKT